MTLCDAHNHLQDERLRPHRPEIFSALRAIGLARAVVNGTSEADWPAVAALAVDHSWIIPSYGLHPWFVSARRPGWQQAMLARVAAGPCAIGEIGLDRWKEPFDFDDQQEVFLWQLALAAEHNRPVTIHCLRAWGRLGELLREHAVPERGFLLHSFAGPWEMVPALIERGGYFSFSGHFLHENQAPRREVFRRLPAERVLIETDAPAMPLPPGSTRFPLPPLPGGEAVNHPANLTAVHDGLSTLRNVSPAELATQVSANFARLFGD